jgi:hypothetical protein
MFLFIAALRLSFPDLDHGDEWAEANVLTAGENFARLGFINCRFLPAFEPNLDKPKDLYTHYPPLPEIINGFLRSAFKADSLIFFRGVSLFFAFLTIIFWYLFITKASGSYFAGFLAALFYMSNPMFLFGVDSLHQSSYSGFLQALILFIFVLILGTPEKKKQRLLLLLLWGLLFIQTWIGLDCVIYLYLFFIFYNFFFKKSGERLSIPAFVFLFAAPAAGFLLHILQNIWYFGGISAAYADLKKVAFERIAASKDSSLPLTLSNWWKYVIVRNFSLVLLFNYYIVFSAALFCCFLYSFISPRHAQDIKVLLRLSILLAICGISWYIVFPAHSLAHSFLFFLSRHLVPFASVVFTILTCIIFYFAEGNNPRNLFGKIALTAVIIAIFFSGIFKSELPVTQDNIARAEDFKKFKACLLSLKEMSSKKDTLGVNYFRYPFIRYYADRHCIVLFDKASLEELPSLPHYFIFMPYNNSSAQELLQYLNQKYAILFQFNSARFPSLFFKLKIN